MCHVCHGQFPPHSRGWTAGVRDQGGAGSVSPALAGMDLELPASPGLRVRFPRTRGDGPEPHVTRPDPPRFPPHSRGWTRHRAAGLHPGRVSPALAGMDRTTARSKPPPGRFPRTRGDGPGRRAVRGSAARFPPHSRGWTRKAPQPGRTDPVSPALAGMDPTVAITGGKTACFPRTRGDGPNALGNLDSIRSFPPHSRGWTREAHPPASHDHVSPALAGMDRPTSSRRRTAASFPRTRGDGPPTEEHPSCRQSFPPHSRGWTVGRAARRRCPEVSPALAGMDPSSAGPDRPPRCFPRTRGDGPGTAKDAQHDAPFPPHSRGWTFHRAAWATSAFVSPALAGMDRTRGRSTRLTCSFPRTRGDGPCSARRRRPRRRFPPHSRGWTGDAPPPALTPIVSPALAGMDPGGSRAPPGNPSFPRTRGDGPLPRCTTRSPRWFPPHSRGWTPEQLPGKLVDEVSPALAGMDRCFSWADTS